MSTAAEILQLRAPLEAGIKAALEAAGITVVTRQALEFQKATPRVEIKCLVGQATGHRNFCPDGILRFDGFRFQLTAQVVTFPQDAAPSTDHETYVGQVRSVFSGIAQSTWADITNFPNAIIAEPLRDSGTQDTLKADNGLEYTILSYTSIVSVRTTAWPTP